MANSMSRRGFLKAMGLAGTGAATLATTSGLGAQTALADNTVSTDP